MLGQSVFYLTLICAVNCLTIKGEKLTNHLNSNPHSHDDDSDKYSDDEAFFYKDDDFNSTLGTRRMIRPVNVGKMPIYFDWREHNGVSAVKNQERCGACWAFSTIGMCYVILTGCNERKKERVTSQVNNYVISYNLPIW